MGYPMHWKRLVNRNGLDGDYEVPDNDKVKHARSMIAGDMRRVEHDMQDGVFTAMFAIYAGITEEQARKVIEAFFDIDIMSGTLSDDMYFKLYQKTYPGGQVIP
jgi:hypothetical protein